MADITQRLRYWRSRPVTADFYDRQGDSLREALTDATDEIQKLRNMLTRFVTIYGDMQDGNGDTPPEIVEARALLSDLPAHLKEEASR